MTDAVAGSPTGHGRPSTTPPWTLTGAAGSTPALTVMGRNVSKLLTACQQLRSVRGVTIVRTAADVPADPARVWQILGEPARAAHWQTTHVRYGGRPPAAFATGVSFVEHVRVLGRPAQVTWTVADADPPVRLAMTGRGPQGLTLLSNVDVRAVAGGSRVSLAQEFTGAAVAAVAGPLEREVKAAQKRSLARLAAAVRDSS